MLGTLGRFRPIGVPTRGLTRVGNGGSGVAASTVGIRGVTVPIAAVTGGPTCVPVRDGQEWLLGFNIKIKNLEIPSKYQYQNQDC